MPLFGIRTTRLPRPIRARKTAGSKMAFFPLPGVMIVCHRPDDFGKRYFAGTRFFSDFRKSSSGTIPECGQRGTDYLSTTGPSIRGYLCTGDVTTTTEVPGFNYELRIGAGGTTISTRPFATS